MKLFPRNGYPYVTLTKQGKQKAHGVHQLIALAFIGPRPDGQEVLHSDGDPLNCTLGNLSYGTHGENMHDRIRHGRDHNVIKTHCPAGHPYDETNTRVYRGSRFCRECMRHFRGNYKGNPVSEDRTHCPQGHAYDEENTYRHNGRRHCRSCKKERMAAWNAKLKAERRAAREAG